MKIKITKGVAIKMEHKDVGSVVDVDEALSKELIGSGKAKPHSENNKPDSREKDLDKKRSKR